MILLPACLSLKWINADYLVLTKKKKKSLKGLFLVKVPYLSNKP